MRWLEEEHSFPENLADFHALRFRDLAARSKLFAKKPPLVVVAGGCGKASTARFLAFMLRAAGLKVGLGTKPPLSESPHGHRERYQLIDSRGEQWIDPELFAEICRPLPDLAAQVPASLGALAPYDLRTWVLLRAFAEWNVDIGIVEANIGLRQDPAGAIPAQLTVLTPIATDHVDILTPPSEWQHLGRSAGPLWHKLSAVPSARVVVGRQDCIKPGDLDELMKRPGPRLGRDFHLQEVQSGRDGSSGLLLYRGGLAYPDGSLRLQLSCLGDFQVENAATAAMAFFELAGHQPESVLKGAHACQFRGRMEVLRQDPLELLAAFGTLSKVKVMLDSLEPFFEGPDTGMVTVLTVLERTAGQGETVAYLARHPRTRALIVTQYAYPNDARDLPAADVATLARQARPGLEVIVCEEPGQAISLGRSRVPSGGLLLLLGSGIAAYSGQSRLADI